MQVGQPVHLVAGLNVALFFFGFRDLNALWNVEDNFYEKLPNISLADMAPGNFK